MQWDPEDITWARNQVNQVNELVEKLKNHEAHWLTVQDYGLLGRALGAYVEMIRQKYDLDGRDEWLAKVQAMAVSVVIERSEPFQAHVLQRRYAAIADDHLTEEDAEEFIRRARDIIDALFNPDQEDG